MLQDNDSKLTALKLKSYLKRNDQCADVQLMKWSPQNLDLNIIGSLWDYLDQRKSEKPSKSKEHRWQVLTDSWNNIPMDYSNRLQLSIPQGINADLAAKDGPTEY